MRDDVNPEAPLEPDTAIASALRSVDDLAAPGSEPAWDVLHARIMKAAEPRLRACRSQTAWNVLGRWARPAIPSALVASAGLAALLVFVIGPMSSAPTNPDSAASGPLATLDASESLASEDPALAPMLRGDEEAILDAALSRED
jgi:hypothetical protein